MSSRQAVVKPPRPVRTGLTINRAAVVGLAVVVAVVSSVAMLNRQSVFAGLALIPGLVVAALLLVGVPSRGRWIANHAEGSITVNVSQAQAMEIIGTCLAARREGWAYHLTTSFSWRSFGERIAVSVEPIAQTACRVVVHSQSSVPTTLIDYGVNRLNVERVLNQIEGPLVGAVTLAAHSVQAERSQRQQAELKLARLQAQVEAHFLYNTLAHVSALVDHDPPSAKRMLLELVDYHRRSARLLVAERTTLGEEFKLVEGYLGVMRLRLGDRLSVHLSLPAELTGVPCLPGTLLTLVENSVKHGIEPSRHGGSIQVVARANAAGEISADVIDTGVGFQASQGGGTGLANLKERLFSVYGARATFALEQGETTGVKAMLTFPVEVPTA